MLEKKSHPASAFYCPVESANSSVNAQTLLWLIDGFDIFSRRGGIGVLKKAWGGGKGGGGV